MTDYLKPTYFIDSDSKAVKEFGLDVTQNASSDVEKAIRLYYAVRDSIRYDPYKFYLNKENFTASNTLSSGSSYCIPKAILLAAVARAVGIPAQLGFSDVKNHLSTQKLVDLMETDIFIWHGYTVLYLNEKWVKATPAFNIEMCERFDVKPLEFDGINDSFMHAFNKQDQQHMEYLRDHGTYADLPYDTLINAIQTTYPKFCEMLAQQQLENDYNFNQEAIST